MTEANIQEGDILVIDKAIEPADGNIVVCFLEGAFTVKRIEKQQGRLYLMPANAAYEPILVTEHSEFVVWGVVTYVIHKVGT